MASVFPLLAPKLSLVPGISHGFFGRQGGVSKGIYAGLNCGGRDTGDVHEDVDENRARVAANLGVTSDALLSVYQIHTPHVVVVEAPWIERPRADAMVTKTPGLALGILAADCAPVLFATRAGDIVGAAHAGWKGALHGVLDNAVTAMEALGARRGDINACLGPCIGQSSYEVGPEFRQGFLDQSAAHDPFFVPNDNGRFQFDLARFVLQRLGGLGLADVEALNLDTYADPERFYSYRRATHAGEPDYGRQISAIAIVPAE